MMTWKPSGDRFSPPAERLSCRSSGVWSIWFSARLQSGKLLWSLISLRYRRGQMAGQIHLRSPLVKQNFVMGTFSKARMIIVTDSVRTSKCSWFWWSRLWLLRNSCIWDLWSKRFATAQKRLCPPTVRRKLSDFSSWYELIPPHCFIGLSYLFFLVVLSFVFCVWSFCLRGAVYRNSMRRYKPISAQHSTCRNSYSLLPHLSPGLSAKSSVSERERDWANVACARVNPCIARINLSGCTNLHASHGCTKDHKNHYYQPRCCYPQISSAFPAWSTTASSTPTRRWLWPGYSWDMSTWLPRPWPSRVLAVPTDWRYDEGLQIWS